MSQTRSRSPCFWFRSNAPAINPAHVSAGNVRVRDSNDLVGVLMRDMLNSELHICHAVGLPALYVYIHNFSLLSSVISGSTTSMHSLSNAFYYFTWYGEWGKSGLMSVHHC